VSGKALRMTGTHLDITASEHARQALAAQQKQLMELVRQMPVPLAMLDAQMRYLAASGRWIADYGLEGQVLEGRSHYEVFPTIPERWKEIHQRALAGETLMADEDRFEREDGRIQWISWDVRPWLAAEDRIGGILMRSEDVTAQVERRMRREGELRLAAVGLMAGGIAHEINSPLQVVSIEQEYIRAEAARDAPDLERLRESADIAEQALERIVAIVQATRNLLRAEREEPTEPVAVETVLEDAKLLSSARFAARGVELTIPTHAPLATVRARRTEIGQIVVNLLNNALDALSGRDGARVEMGITVEGPMVVVAVTDNGPGIAPSDSDRIMEPFFTTKPPGQGSGLGLSISHAFATRAGGSLRLTSRANPTTFELRLPLATLSPERASD
jgi:PAS domain S-box-containing protein